MPKKKSVTAPANRQRRRQDRSEDTRLKILEATIECLSVHGLADTSTSMICEQAGVTRGAYLHHFGSRDTLIIESLGHMLDSSFGVVEYQMIELIRNEEYEKLFDTIWDLSYNDWLYAGFELILKARTHDSIREEWLKYSARFKAVRRRLFGQAFGEDLIRETNLLQVIEGMLDLLRGVKLMSTIRTPEETQAQLDLFRDVFAREIRAVTSAHRPSATGQMKGE